MSSASWAIPVARRVAARLRLEQRGDHVLQRDLGGHERLLDAGEQRHVETLRCVPVAWPGAKLRPPLRSAQR